MKDKVSIITACYNSEKTIERTIKSVIDQCYDGEIEYIIIDGKSSDSTMNIVNKYSDYISKAVSEKDLGIYNAFNKGLRLCTGSIIGIINSDDWYSEDAIQSSVNNLNSNDADISIGYTQMINQKNTYLKKVDDLSCFWEKMPFGHPSVFARKTVYEQIGFFDESYSIAADYKWLLDCYVNRKKYSAIDKVIANFTVGGISSENLIKTTEESIRACIDVLDKNHINDYGLYNKIIESRLGIFLDALIANDFEKYRDMINEYYPDFTAGVAIVGAGVWGRKIKISLEKMDIKIDHWVDNNYQNIEIDGIESLDVLREYCNTVIVAIKKLDDGLVRQLKNLEIKKYISLEDYYKKVGGYYFYKLHPEYRNILC